MKKIRAGALLLLSPTLAAALPVPDSPGLVLPSTPFTLVANALDQQPKFDFFPPPVAATPVAYVDRMVVITPGPQADQRMVHAPDASVDYKLTIGDPGLVAGK